MPKNAEKWQPQAERSYFLKLANGCYARIEFKMIAGGDHYFKIESYLNPSGSRNLEYDPKKSITPERIKEIGLEKAIEEARGK